MTFIYSLWNSSGFWEWVEYVAELLVIVGALFEVSTDFEWVLKGDVNKHLRHRLAKIAAVTLVVGLAIELGALARTNALFAKDITSAYNASKDASGQAKVANEAATVASGQATAASKDAKGANDRASGLARENIEERKKSDAFAVRLEDERNRRALLAASLLPRNFKDQSGAAKALSSLPPVSVILQFEDFDPEARSVARQIAFVFSLLRWPCHRSHVDEYQIVEEGIVMKPGLKSTQVPTGFEQDARISANTSRVAQKLSSLLNTSGIDAKEGNMFGDLAYTPTTLIIKIGRKPNHVLEETLRELGPRPKGVPFNGITTDGSIETSIPEEAVPPKP